MRGLVTGVLMVLRLCWLVAIVLGVTFWTGHLLQLVPVHMLLGLLIALGLIVLAVIAGIRGKFPLLVGGIVVAILLPLVGLNQGAWLPGSAHWIIQIIHLVVGVIAIATAESIAGQLGARRR
jgi:hypothetical protein